LKNRNKGKEKGEAAAVSELPIKEGWVKTERRGFHKEGLIIQQNEGTLIVRLSAPGKESDRLRMTSFAVCGLPK